MKNYEIINGVKYNKEIIDLADQLVTRKEDGVLSVDDAGQIFTALKENGIYTEIEKDTICYILENYQWTSASDEWIRLEITQWNQKK